MGDIPLTTSAIHNTALDPMAALRPIWGDQIGYVFLPVIRRGTEKWTEGRAFEWPAEAEAVCQHVEQHMEARDNLYFTPGVFALPARKRGHLASRSRLWADLDEADPRLAEAALRPTVAWETSPGRYAGVWLLDSDVKSTADLIAEGGLNQRLSYRLGADKSGWDETQVLRVPGSWNAKRKKFPEPVPGRILWTNGPTPAPAELARILPAPAEPRVGRYARTNSTRTAARGALPNDLAELIAAPPADVEGRDRSEVLWSIECRLAERGFSPEEIVETVERSVWNKFAGRPEALLRDARKACESVARQGSEGSTADGFAAADWGAGGADETGQTAIFTSDDPVEKLLEQLVYSEDLDELPDPEPLIEGVLDLDSEAWMIGVSGHFKSFVALDMAMHVASGKLWRGRRPPTAGSSTSPPRG
ncbi:hypothetical protein HMPREF9336_00815 [Segniliparus rugosus ATCC BAA-974]|uniref:RepB-like DNA primase domain-containing protein n=1 Tax=Segniliparus rugosus (strain ATCC BAA-974 / DSM 45345 / CCUG 50838 / CIP 108380 / JCM 13579 / CDC 945) TaxID=679197 RepID=E5XMU5_SEGRC|nr:AAA family ATPase [Segniliparus rugosus]EFV14318.1 hypothetical protein HMPREF9336_00815 [Segniliparus rugosus ATCC BAA-974]